MDQLNIKIENAAVCLCDGDILLFRPTTRYGKIVAWWTKGKHGHAAMLMKNGVFLTVLEIFEEGFRTRSVEDYLKESAVIDVYRVTDKGYDGITATSRMFEYRNCRYGWWHAFVVGLKHVFPLLFRRKKECSRDHSPHCSQAVSYATREGGGVDLVPELPDYKTTPKDLADSKLLKYVCTLQANS